MLPLKVPVGQRLHSSAAASATAVPGGHTELIHHTATNSEPLLAFAPQKGAALLHAHGERCLTHEGAAVESGAKYLLRTDVAY